MKKLLISLSLAMTLTGCELYFGQSDDTGGGTGGGWNCTQDADCASGCYCAKPDAPKTDSGAPTGQGVCQEAGFCSDDADCPAGFKCDARNSCVPDAPPTCGVDGDCAAGSFCNVDGVCEPSCVCANDAEAMAAGWHHCDEARMTCEPAGDFTCGGTATCGTRPTCAVGSVATMDASGCYTGACETITPGCDVTPTCEARQHEADCLGVAGCGASYTGINCTKPDGSACMAGDTGCTCQNFVFASCRGQTSSRTVMDQWGHYIDAAPLFAK